MKWLKIIYNVVKFIVLLGTKGIYVAIIDAWKSSFSKDE